VIEITLCSPVLVSYLYKCLASMWQLADEAIKLFDATIADMGLTINYFLMVKILFHSFLNILRPCIHPYRTLLSFLSFL
jgi:hypothetical protein